MLRLCSRLTMKASLSEYNRKLQRLLVEARIARGFKQSEVAARLQVPQSFVSKYERGERSLDVIEFLRVSQVLGLDACEILRNIGLPRDSTEPANILERLYLTAGNLTKLVDANPSLWGMLLGYVAEYKLQEIWLSGSDVKYLGKSDDHDRSNKGDHIIEYQDEQFVIESKSLQSRMIHKEGDTWYGKAQVDASDRRTVTLKGGTQLETTLLMVGEFDVLAVNCFAFEQQWKFVFAKNSDLPRSTYRKYPAEVRDQLLASLVAVSWPPEPPFTSSLVEVLDQLIVDRRSECA